MIDSVFTESHVFRFSVQVLEMSVIIALQNDYAFPVRLSRDTYAFALIRERMYSEYFFSNMQKYAEQLAMYRILERFEIPKSRKWTFGKSFNLTRFSATYRRKGFSPYLLSNHHKA